MTFHEFTPAQIALERTPRFRQKVVTAVADAAREARVAISVDIEDLLQAYLNGEMSCDQLVDQIGRIGLH